MPNKIIPQKDNTSLPAAPGVLIPPLQEFTFKRRKIRSNGWRFLVNTCPYCNKQHLHGGHPDPAELGETRVSHCGRGQYRLVGEGQP